MNMTVRELTDLGSTKSPLDTLKISYCLVFDSNSNLLTSSLDEAAVLFGRFFISDDLLDHHVSDFSLVSCDSDSFAVNIIPALQRFPLGIEVLSNISQDDSVLTIIINS